MGDRDSVEMYMGRTDRKVTTMKEYKPTKGFIEDIVKLACLCDENDIDSLEIGFTLKDGRRAIVEMTFRTEEGDDNG